MPSAVSTDLPGTDAQVMCLDNGLVVIALEDRSAPVVSAQAWCRAGSVDEGRWLGAGLSHVLEHMLFKGTTTRGPGRIDQEVHDAGGYMNAYTSFDRTVYWINVPNTGARVAIDVLCDIMQNATLPADELARELDVIRREMDMCHDDPGRRSSRRLFETAYTRSPYRYPIIGLPDIFNTLTRDDVAAYYREKYAPNNCFLVVVGAISPEEAIDQIGAAFASAKARPIASVPLSEEPRQTAPRERVEEATIELGYLHASWHIPELRHADVPALDVLSVVLGAGRSSRVHVEVREKAGLVHSADAWTYNPGSPGLFGLSAVVDRDKFGAARDALLREVERLRTDGVRPGELAKAAKQMTVATLSSRKSMQGQAQELGASWLVTGDLSFSASYLDAVRRVTVSELQRVAAQYLAPENRTLYALLPAGSRASKVAARATPVPSAVERFILPNGLRLLVREDDRLPFVELRAAFLGGVLAETSEDNGITGLVAKLLLKGTGRRTGEELAIAIESVGGSLDTYAGNNSFGISAEVMDGDLDLGFDLVTDTLLNPSFPEAEVERERTFQLAGIRAQRDQLLHLAIRSMRRGLFGEAGYGLDASGTETSVATLTRDQLQRFHSRSFVPGSCVLAVFGCVRQDQVVRAVEERLGAWSSGDRNGHVVKPLVPSKAPVRLVEHRDKKQAVVAMGFPGAELKSPERHALELIQESCSDLGSRLFIRIRDELGLAYYVGAQNFVGLVPGFFSFYAGIEPDREEQVVAEFLAEIGRLRSDGLTEAELRRAKAKVIGQKKIARQDLGACAMGAALDELYGLGFAYSDSEDAHYEAVTSEDVVRAARMYLRPEARVLAVVRPEDAQGS